METLRNIISNPVIMMFLTIAISVSLIYLSRYLRNKNMIKESDLDFAVTILGLGIQVVDELNLKNESQIKQIAEIVKSSVEYVAETYHTNIDLSEETYKYACYLMSQANIELTDERRDLIKRLIKLSVDNKKLNN